jgi:hypothetical protein
MKLFCCTLRPYRDEIVLMYTSPLLGWNCSVVHLALIGMKLFWCTPQGRGVQQNNFIPIRARCTSEQFHPDKGEVYIRTISLMYTSPLLGWNCSVVHLALIGMKLFWCTPRPYRDEIVLMYTSPLSGWNCSDVPEQFHPNKGEVYIRTISSR